MLLEIAANSLASALAAERGGADRVELCSSLADGGVTPSAATIAMAREQLRIPLYVLIRPRAGHFVYDAPELELMRRDIKYCVKLGCNGVAIGALNTAGAVDMPAMRMLIDAAGALAITFHRAFDVVRNRRAALGDLVVLGCERVLTSGGADTAGQGAAAIAATVADAAGRLAVMAGAGLSATHIAQVAAISGANELHASARATITPEVLSPASLAGLAPHYQQTDEALVRALVTALRGV